MNGVERESESPAVDLFTEGTPEATTEVDPNDDDQVILGLLDDGDDGHSTTDNTEATTPQTAPNPDIEPGNPAQLSNAGTSDTADPTPALDDGDPDEVVDAVFIDVNDMSSSGGPDSIVQDLGAGTGVLDPPSADSAAIDAAGAVDSANSPEQGPTAGEPADDPQPRPPILDLEMRQVAGLTSGSAMSLTPGKTYEFSESTKGVSFGIQVLEDGQVIVLPGSARAIVNEVEVTEPTFLGDGILQVGSACFSVRPVRPAGSTMSRLETLQANLTAPAAIPVPPLGDTSGIPPAGGRIGDPTTPAGAFLHTVRRTRDSVAERHRLTHPDPEEIKSRLAGLEPGLWERSTDHRLFGRFGVAYASIPWQPRFDTPELIPPQLHQAIADMSLLPWVPVTANLKRGPFGIVGSRAATLACVRHAVLSLASVTAPGGIGFWVVTGRSHLEDWQWTMSLPVAMSPEGGASFMVAVVDGMDHVEKAGLDWDEIAAGRTGLIAVTTEEAKLPEGCGTVLRLHDDGSADVTNHLGETVLGTPIGVTQSFALDMASRIAGLLAEIES